MAPGGRAAAAMGRGPGRAEAGGRADRRPGIRQDPEDRADREAGGPGGNNDADIPADAMVELKVDSGQAAQGRRPPFALLPQHVRGRGRATRTSGSSTREAFFSISTDARRTCVAVLICRPCRRLGRRHVGRRPPTTGRGPGRPRPAARGSRGRTARRGRRRPRRWRRDARRSRGGRGGRGGGGDRGPRRSRPRLDTIDGGSETGCHSLSRLCIVRGIGPAAPCRVNLARSLPRQSGCRLPSPVGRLAAPAGRRGGRPADRVAGDRLARGRSGRRSDFLPTARPRDERARPGRTTPPLAPIGPEGGRATGRTRPSGWVRSPIRTIVSTPRGRDRAARGAGLGRGSIRRPFSGWRILPWNSCMK